MANQLSTPPTSNPISRYSPLSSVELSHTPSSATGFLNPIAAALPPALTSPAISSPQGTSTEALERQPRHVGGYDWNEQRTEASRGTDGTASLSMEPDGQG